MNKRIVIQICLILVFPLIFNAVFFLSIKSLKDPSVCISYIFIHFGYIMLLLTPVFVRKEKAHPVFGLSIHAVSSIYFLVEFVVGVVFIFLRMKTYKPALFAQLIISGVYLSIFLSHLIANEDSVTQKTKHVAEVSFIKESSSRLKQLSGKLMDKNADRQIRTVCDLFHASPVKSSEQVISLESEIMQSIQNLEGAVNQNDGVAAARFAGEIQEILEKRNQTLKLLNQRTY